MLKAFLAITADKTGGCIMACTIDKKTWWHHSYTRPDPDDRVKLPRWLKRALKKEAVQILIEGGRNGSDWREFVAWCDETSKPREGRDA